MWVKCRTWLVVGIVLLAAHGTTAWHYAARYERGGVFAGSKALKLDMTPDEWARASGDSDAAGYLQVAENFALGRGVTLRVTDQGPPHDLPFYYWAPGTPVVFGSWLKLFGGQTMWTFFWFAVVAQLLFGVISVATASIWTRNLWALATVALCTGICPPLQQWFYGACLTSSEIVVLVPLSAIVFALAKGFAAYHENPSQNHRRKGDSPQFCSADSAKMGTVPGGFARGSQVCGTFWANALQWRVILWFALAGILIGLNSLIRDAAEVLATFVVVFMVGRALVFDRRRLALAACCAAVLLASANFVRFPVKRWNQHRIGDRMVSTGAAWGVWYVSIWSQHDKFAWFAPCGVGFGEYLDPAAAKRVKDYFDEKKPHRELYSLGQLAQAVWKRPLDAIAFKAVRLPVLWLGTTGMWPKIQWSYVSTCCIAFYGSFAVFCGMQLRRRRRIPEVLYIYLLMMVCASAIVHYEFRYTFPVWNSLVMAPGLMLAALSRRGWLPQSSDQPSDAAPQASQSESDSALPLAA